MIELTGPVIPKTNLFLPEKKRELTGPAILANFLVSGERELTGSAISGAKLVFRFKRLRTYGSRNPLEQIVITREVLITKE